MKRERRGRNVEDSPDGSGGKALRTRLHEHPEHVETGFVCQGGKSANGDLFFHISNAIEM